MLKHVVDDETAGRFRTTYSPLSAAKTAVVPGLHGLRLLLAFQENRFSNTIDRSTTQMITSPMLAGDR